MSFRFLFLLFFIFYGVVAQEAKEAKAKCGSLVSSPRRLVAISNRFFFLCLFLVVCFVDAADGQLTVFARILRAQDFCNYHGTCNLQQFFCECNPGCTNAALANKVRCITQSHALLLLPNCIAIDSGSTCANGPPDVMPGSVVPGGVKVRVSALVF